ncbi:sugar transferase [Hungatella hathewayi]|uniref:sugar transferase n=1 Tax=Hungatella hathewayi TaxID=154046 RepID=UPI00033675AE|nr:sugar transferase [Hungatella hathewayi]CCZ63608.1 putative uncharacterized protein [Hungatella hathewayi CAG:224]
MQKGWIRHLDFFIVDLVGASAAYVLSCLFFYLWHEAAPARSYVSTGLQLLILQMLTAFLLDVYEGAIRRGYIKEMSAVFRQEFIVNAAFLLLLYLQKSMFYSRLIFCLTIIFTVFFVYTGRVLLKEYLKRRYSCLKNTRQIMVVAAKEAAERMTQAVTETAIRDYRFLSLAVIDREMTGERIGTVEVCAGRKGLLDYIDRHVIDEVLINVAEEPDYVLELSEKLLDMGKTVHLYLEQPYETLPHRRMGNVFGFRVMTSTISPISDRQLLLKRMIDLVGGLAGCLITLLLLAVIGPAICICSPGPVFFRQVRVGKNGRRFQMYKFRSMYPDAEMRKKELMEKNQIAGGLMFKLEKDPRIIKGIGHFIRKTSLDEFPQFFNVLKGDMSLVGTRPPTEDEYERYSLHHKKRLNMRPGITGLWQVMGRSRILDFEKVVELDVRYIQNWSLGGDIKILAKTVMEVITGEGAK